LEDEIIQLEGCSKRALPTQRSPWPKRDTKRSE
jgi:hypothetical protein